MKTRLPICALCLLFALLFSSCGEQPMSELRQDFEPNGLNEPYELGVPLSEMDFSDYWGDVNITIAPALSDYVRMVELPCTMEYYLTPTDAAPAFTLEKGTKVCVIPKNGRWLTIGYGLMCWPDYLEGWRYGYPFIPADINSVESIGDIFPRYYVKTEQLFSVAEAFYWANTKIYDEDASLEDFQRHNVLLMDAALYMSGAFCSPDLEKYFVTEEFDDSRMIRDQQPWRRNQNKP